MVHCVLVREGRVKGGISIPNLLLHEFLAQTSRTRCIFQEPTVQIILSQDLIVISKKMESFFEILASTHGPGPYAHGP